MSVFGGRAGESPLSVIAKKHNYSLCALAPRLSLSLSLSPPLVSALRLPHLITSQCLTTVREGSHEEHHSLICLTYPLTSMRCVCVCVCVWWRGAAGLCAHVGDNESIRD